MKKFEVLRKKHPRFVYDSFFYRLKGSGLEIIFTLIIEPDIVFRPKILIRGVRQKDLDRISRSVLDNLVFHLGLAEIPSYWKCAVSHTIEIRAGHLTPRQIRFFEGLVREGLGEFFYANRIRPTKAFFHIHAVGPIFPGPRVNLRERAKNNNRILLAVGGGKDSLVAAEILKKSHSKFQPMILGNVPAAYRLLRAMKTAPPISIKRIVDPTLLALNKNGYLNGHTPFSAYLAFLGILIAELLGYDEVMVANERSANEPTMAYRGRFINHQYSKSFAFERDFRGYARTYLTKQTRYMSILRPLYEIQIARIAAARPEMLRASISCNVGQKQGRWCGACAKCMAVFILLFPFMESQKLVAIFKKNLLDDASLWHFIPALTGNDPKPFDCVATKKEMRAALILSLEKAKREGNIPKLLSRFSKELRPKVSLRHATIHHMLHAWDRHNFLPRNIAKVMKEMIREPF